MIALQWLLLMQCFISGTAGAKILIAAPFSGSHYFATSDIGHLLAKQGHQVTFVAPIIDPRNIMEHENFTLLPPFWKIEGLGGNDTYGCVMSIIESERDDYLYIDTQAANEVCKKKWEWLYQILINYYTSDQFLQLLMDEQFDLIVAEDRTSIPILAVTNNIPLAVYFPEVEYSRTRMAQNLPQFLCSEPSMAIQVYDGEKPGFWRRLYGIYNLVVGGAKLISAVETMLKPVYAKYGIKSTQSLLEKIQLFIINDHPAFSFPYQVANNVVQVGGSSLTEGKPLQGDLKMFVRNQTDPIVYVSMGTYIDFIWLKWHAILLKVLQESEFSVVLKVNEETQYKLPELSSKFFVSSWVPQRDLLASGDITLFISHCGNNGKIETIYYQVPVLCTPTIGDQGINADAIKHRGFGELILPTKITRETLKRVIDKMIKENESYREEMSKAVDIFKTDPASGQDKLMYYLNLMLKHGNLDHLINQIMMQQNFLEMYHLDIILFVILSTTIISYLIFKIVSRVVLIVSFK